MSDEDQEIVWLGSDVNHPIEGACAGITLYGHRISESAGPGLPERSFVDVVGFKLTNPIEFWDNSIDHPLMEKDLNTLVALGQAGHDRGYLRWRFRADKKWQDIIINRWIELSIEDNEQAFSWMDE